MTDHDALLKHLAHSLFARPVDQVPVPEQAAPPNHAPSEGNITTRTPRDEQDMRAFVNNLFDTND